MISARRTLKNICQICNDLYDFCPKDTPTVNDLSDVDPLDVSPLAFRRNALSTVIIVSSYYYTFTKQSAIFIWHLGQMIIRIIPKKPRRGLILLTPDKKITDFRSLGPRHPYLSASRRDAISTFRAFADNRIWSFSK